MSCFVMVRRASGPIAVRPYPACRSSFAFRSAPFRSPRRRPGCGGTLFRAYCAPARQRALAPARFARLIARARARPRNQGARLPSVPLETFSRRREAAPRMPLPLLHISTDFRDTSPLRELFPKNIEQNAFICLRPPETTRTGPGATVLREPRLGHARTARTVGKARQKVDIRFSSEGTGVSSDLPLRWRIFAVNFRTGDFPCFR